MKIVLVGYMGSGKTTIGKGLAKALDIKFLDLDSYIERALRMKVAGIFEEKGEIYFRKQEHFFLKEVLVTNKDFIVSTGGGTPCYSGNMDVMLQNSDAVIYLKVSIPELVNRLAKEKEHRPLLKDKDDEALTEFIAKHLFERSAYYNQATHTVNCDGKSVTTLVEELKSLLV